MHDHRFDPVSGWCHGCPLRDDGRLVDGAMNRNHGRVLREGTTQERAESNDAIHQH